MSREGANALTVRLAPADMLLVHDAAARAGHSLSDFVRRGLDLALREQGHGLRLSAHRPYRRARVRR